MVIGGFPRDTPRADICEKINQILQEAEVTAKEVFTFEKYGSMGVANFGTGEVKKKFKKFLADAKAKRFFHRGDDGLWAGDNMGKDERFKRRSMGKVKKAIHEVLGEVLEIDVDYKRCVVRHQKEIVAKYDELGTLLFTGAAWDSRERVWYYANEMKMKTNGGVDS